MLAVLISVVIIGIAVIVGTLLGLSSAQKNNMNIYDRKFEEEWVKEKPHIKKRQPWD